MFAPACVVESGLCKPAAKCFFGTSLAVFAPDPAQQVLPPQPSRAVSPVLLETILIAQKVDALQDSILGVIEEVIEAGCADSQKKKKSAKSNVRMAVLSYVALL